MSTIRDVFDRVAKLNLCSEVPVILNDTKDQLRQTQQAQLEDGIGKDGRIIRPAYTAHTQFIKAKKGQPYDRVTLKDTGEFWDSIQAKPNQSKIEWDATDWKFEKLVEKYTDNILGLSPVALDVYVDGVFFPRVKSYVHQTTGLK